MNYKKFGILFMIVFIILLINNITITIVHDPFFHYHKPFPNAKYRLDRKYQRYQNYGIVTHFDYDAIIIGTSMTENFKTSEFDELFQTHSIKVPLKGAYYKELNDLLTTALESHNNTKYVIRSLDYYAFFVEKDQYRYDLDSYPTYLYNESKLDDINYVLNKEVFFYILDVLENKGSTTFDAYSNWSRKYQYGKEVLDSSYKRPKKKKNVEFTNQDIEVLNENVKQNVIEIVKQYPETQFYLFYPPYSIYYWDSLQRKGTLDKMLYGEKLITEMLLEYDNVHLFSFLSAYDVITNLKNYRDYSHYSGKINSMILKSMKNGEYELTKDNYENYYEKVIPYYQKFQYDTLFEQY